MAALWSGGVNVGARGHDEGHLSLLMSVLIVQNFGSKFLLRRGECKTRENSNFWKNGKIVILVKI